MKIYKLLFLLLVSAGLYSCSEYLDNGMRNDGYEPPEVSVYVAKLKNSESGIYAVGDSVVFMAELNGVDVTSTSVFKVDGVDVLRPFFPKSRNVYVAQRPGLFSVVATLDGQFTSSFGFTVEETNK